MSTMLIVVPLIAVVLLILIKIVIQGFMNAKDSKEHSDATHSTLSKIIGDYHTRRRVIKKEKEGYTFPNGMKVGNAQLIGDNDIQSNYFSVLDGGNSVFAVVADGIGKDNSGRLSAIVAVEILKHNFKLRCQMHPDLASANDFFNYSFSQIQKRLRDNVNHNKPGAKLVCVLIEEHVKKKQQAEYQMITESSEKELVLNYASVGDCILFVCREERLIQLNNHPDLRTGKITLEEKDIVFAASRGAWDNLTEMEIVWHLHLEDHPQEKCQMLLERAQKKLLVRECATVVILEQLPIPQKI